MMATPQVLCLGEVLVDQFQMGDRWQPQPGGAPANVACGLVKQGIRSAFLGAVGDDTWGSWLGAILASVGVETSGLETVFFPTRNVYITRDDRGDRHFIGFGEGVHAPFADEQMGAVLSEDLFRSAEMLVFGSASLASETTAQALMRALDLADRHNLKIFFDVNRRPLFWGDEAIAGDRLRAILPRVDFLKATVEESQWLFGTADAGAIAHRHDAFDGVLITGGGDSPIRYCLGEYEGKVAPLPVPTVDTTGAGDSFVAGFVAQLLHHGMGGLGDRAQAEAMVRYGAAAGALTTLHTGAIAPQPLATEVMAFLRSGDRDGGQRKKGLQ